ncbi:MAG: ParB/RepB/Spo0J family partition protein [Xanthomonadales bacterium]|jgi:ParB family chromosome partitioning protein|nr:ParB/RepB/Spo0J family partition protein [Xanthomonadales bacterium]
MSKARRGLGRGLDALLGGDELAGAAPDSIEAGERVRTLPIEQIVPGRYQPRSSMDPQKLAELADSIRAHGVVQPVLVRAIGSERYELIAGERRWRAAQLAGMREIPSLVRVVADKASVAMALVENIQREDLSPLEEAQALRQLIDEFGMTHSDAAEAVGRSRAAVSNLLRLLELAAEVRKLLDQRLLEMGHGRALLALPEAEQIRLARLAVEQQWSVRDTEEAVRRALAPPSAKPSERAKHPDVVRLEQDLAERLGAPVRIDHRNGRGKLVVAFHSLDALDGILAKIR